MSRSVDTRRVEQRPPKDLILYHLSFRGELEGRWTPQPPDGLEYVDEDIGPHSEPSNPRISLSPTLEQCFRAIYPNISHLFEKRGYPHLDIYAYQAHFQGRERMVLPEDLTRQRWVWDAHVTDEHWCLDPLEMVKVGRYRFYAPTGAEYRTHPFGDRSQGESIYVGPQTVQFEALDKAPSLESSVPLSLLW